MGSLAILYCRATGNPIPRVQWYKDDTTVNPISSPFQQTLIVPTNMPYTTVYTCKGTNYIGNMKHTRFANITVIVKGSLRNSNMPSMRQPGLCTQNIPIHIIVSFSFMFKICKLHKKAAKMF